MPWIDTMAANIGLAEYLQDRFKWPNVARVRDDIGCDARDRQSMVALGPSGDRPAFCGRGAF
jgi:hypothetical protein